MFRILVTLTLICAILPSLSFAQAQPKSYTTSIMGNDAQWMEAFPVGDSVLLAYVVYSANEEFRRACWMTSTGVATPIELDTEGLFSINKYGDEVYYYVLEEIKKKLYLTAIVDKPGTKRFIPKEQIPIEGDIVDEFTDKNQFLLLYDKKKSKLIELELSKMQIINRRELIIPSHMSEQVGKNGFQLIKEGSFFNSFLGSAKVKLYRNKEGEYTIAVDERHSTNKRPIPRDKITGTHINTLGDTAINIIPFTKGSDEFRSWLVDGKLFRYSINRKLTALEIIDVASGKPVTDLDLQGDYSKFNIFSRDAVGRRIDQKTTFQEITSTAPRSNPSVYVQLGPDGKYLVMTGSKMYPAGADTGMISAGIMFGVTGVLVYTMVGGMRHASEGKGIDRYYYNTFDPASNKLDQLSMDTRTNLRDAIDRFEMVETNLPSKVHLQGYAENDRYVVGYYYNAKQENVQIVWFPR